MLVFVVKLLKE